MILDQNARCAVYFSYKYISQKQLDTIKIHTNSLDVQFFSPSTSNDCYAQVPCKHAPHLLDSHGMVCRSLLQPRVQRQIDWRASGGQVGYPYTGKQGQLFEKLNE